MSTPIPTSKWHALRDRLSAPRPAPGKREGERPVLLDGQPSGWTIEVRKQGASRVLVWIRASNGLLLDNRQAIGPALDCIASLMLAIERGPDRELNAAGKLARLQPLWEWFERMPGDAREQAPVDIDELIDDARFRLERHMKALEVEAKAEAEAEGV
jgi:hypothetical protein